MKPIYLNDLRKHLDRVYFSTSTTIPWNELYMWFGTQKIAKNTYRYIQKAWEDLCEDHADFYPDRDPTQSDMPALRVINRGNRDTGLILQREPFHSDTTELLEDLI